MTASFAAYEKYGPSVVDWLGPIPETWTVVPVGRLFRRKKATNFPEEQLLSVYRDYGVVPKNSRDDNFNKPSEDLSSYQLVEPGDLVLNKMKTWQGSIAVSDYRGIVSPAYIVCEPNPLRGALPQFSPKFLHYSLRSPKYVSQYLRYSKGIRVNQWDLGFDEFKSIEVLLPPLGEQEAIVRFLDYETARIDDLIATQQRLIELLREKRQAVVTHAITGGLDSARPTKDGGSEWLPRIPAGWELPALSAITNKITNGYVGPTRDVLVDDGVRYLQSTHVKRNAINFSVPYFVPPAWSEQHRKSVLKEGDVLIVQTGDIGQVAVVPPEFEGANCHALIIASPTKAIRGRFLSWVLNSDYGYHSLKSLQTGALHPHLNCDAVKTIKVPVPPLEEQDQIVRYIDGELESIERAGSGAQQMIDLLRERRAAVISAAVIGQIDVRGWESGAAADQEKALGD